MKAYCVYDIYSDWNILIFAPNAGRAKSLFMSHSPDPYGHEYTDIRASRKSAYDGIYNEEIVIEHNSQLPDDRPYYEEALTFMGIDVRDRTGEYYG